MAERDFHVVLKAVFRLVSCPDPASFNGGIPIPPLKEAGSGHETIFWLVGLLTLGAHAHSEGYSSCRVCMYVCVCVCMCDHS